MKSHPNMSNEEWKAFLEAIPEKKEVPIENRDILLKKEGVTEDDLRWWNSMSDEEQEKLKETLQIQNKAIVFSLAESGMSYKDAFIKAHKTIAVYDDCVDEIKEYGFHENDYPLPWELSDRIGRFMMMVHKSEMSSDCQKAISVCTSANAAIRYFIRKGII